MARKEVPWHERYKVDVPEGGAGDWNVSRFELARELCARERVRMTFSGEGHRAPRAGKFTKLTRNGSCIMSDTQVEISDHLELFHAAEGQVLLNGLGLGVALNGCLLKKEVEHVTVIEISPDVISLCGEHWKEKYGDRITIIEADAFEWTPPKGTVYGAAWHDIWDNICADNYEEIKKLRRRYARRSKWQGTWCLWETKQQVKNDRYIMPSFARYA